MQSNNNWKEVDTVASHPIHHFRKLGFQEIIFSKENNEAKTSKQNRVRFNNTGYYEQDNICVSKS